LIFRIFPQRRGYSAPIPRTPPARPRVRAKRVVPHADFTDDNTGLVRGGGIVACGKRVLDLGTVCRAIAVLFQQRDPLVGGIIGLKQRRSNTHGVLGVSGVYCFGFWISDLFRISCFEFVSDLGFRI
jgi:hypothetical protein